MISQELITAAQAAQRKWKVWASVSLAQYGIESAWGTREPKGSNNGFGIQALHGLPSVSAESFEYVNGVRTPKTEHFAVFKSIADAFDKHGELLATNSAYKEAMATTTAKAFVVAMAKKYATAPTYADTILGLMRSDNLEQYDKLPSVGPADPPTSGPAPGPAQTKDTPMASTPTPTPAPAPAAPVTSTATSKLAAVLNLMSGLNLQQISDFVEGKQTLQQGITTAEEFAQTLLYGATVLGVPFAGEAALLLPTAEKWIALAEEFFPTAQGVIGSVVASVTQNAPTIKTGR